MLKILIADDENWMLKCMLECIDWEKEGFEVVGLAENGPQALNLILEKEPNIVFTDIKMPGMNGIEILKQVKKTHKHIEFIFLSGYNSFDYAKDAINYGALGYLLKPVETAELITILNTAKEKIYTEKNNTYLFSTDLELEALKNKNFYENLVFQIKTYIASHYMEDINLESIAREFKFSPNYLSKTFKNKEGERLLDYLIRYRIDIAKKLLWDTRHTITDVATLVGYRNNPKYFTKIFKKLEGITPQEYIQKKPR